MGYCMINMSKETAAYCSEMTANRRALHQIPEEGLAEFQTRSYLVAQLQAMGITDIRFFYNTGIRAVIAADKPQGTIGFRADMDALCIKECNTHSFVSKQEGMMHACGHDGHMALLLGLAHYCMDHRAELKYNVVCLFQPAEESVGGAEQMILQGALEQPKVDLMLGFHLMPEVLLGKIGVKSGPMMAQTCEFDVVFNGKSAHGAMPHKGADTIAAACEFYNNIQTILTRRIDPYEHALITIGKFSGGSRRNIISDKTVLEGTMRTFSEEVYQTVKDLLLAKMNASAQNFGANAEFKEVTVYPVVSNPEKQTKTIMQIIGEENICPVQPMMIAEDFSYYQKSIPAVFMFLGCKPQAQQAPGSMPLHSNVFDFDETALCYGLETYIKILKSNVL